MFQIDIPIVVFPTTCELVPEPLGVVLIFSSWNFPIGTSAIFWFDFKTVFMLVN